MPRSRTTKTIAKRIDLSYFKRSHPMRRWRRVLTWLAGAAALIWLAAASVRISGGKVALVDRIHNPGHVSAAHAMFENDCAQCHASKAGGGFTVAVTDQSCLRCHDGAIHHPNQKIATDISLVSHDRQILAVHDDKHVASARSAACATCHVEHRGQPALAAASDAHCIVCHADLATSTTDADPKAPREITSFALNDHPAFGRKLRASEGKWKDPTILRFNHQYHLEKVPEIRDVANNCATCHSPEPSDRRYMRPISYAKNCQSCHQLRPTAEVAVVHEDLSIVRWQLMSPGALFEQALGAMSKEHREQQLVKKVTRNRRTTTQPISESEWIEAKVTDLAKQIFQWAESDEAKKLPGLAEVTAATSQPSDAHADARLFEYFVAYGMSQSCAKCHDIKQGASPGTLATVPTGFAVKPARRWFTASVFDHDAHRDQTCRDCHAAAWTSSKTADLLLPDLNAAGTTGQSCVSCHVATTSSRTRGAPADCVTCHTFHDRSLEQVTYR